MKFNSLILKRPFAFFIALALIVLVLSSLLIRSWIFTVKKVENEVESISNNIYQEIDSSLDDAAKMLIPINSSATNLARILSSSLDKTDLSFSNIESKMAPFLFQAFSTIPYLSEIAYIGMDGLFFSFYNKGDQEPFAVYSNSSFSKNANAMSTKYTWYTQAANSETGNLYGEAVEFPATILVNASWFQHALSSTNGYASLGNSWNGGHDLLFLNTAAMDGRGAVSLGFQVKPFIDIFRSVDLDGGSLYLAAKDGNVLIEGIPNTHMVLSGTSVTFKLLKPNGNHQIGHVGHVTCRSYNGTIRATILTIGETKYVLYCSLIEIIGVQSVYVLALPYDGLESRIHNNINVAFWLLILIVVGVVISIPIFVALIVKSARREMCLRAGLIKQKEWTQQAERKSMKKSLAFASASHDIRTSLAGITGLIEMSHNEVEPQSDLAKNLRQMESNAKDLLGILNSILDTSKIEAGKMQLEEEEFDLAKMLEDVVDLFYAVGLKKGIDVILDPSVDIVTKFSHVKGDRGRLKQILSNLISNAVKFTSKGYISVRAYASKRVQHSNILVSSPSKPIQRLFCLFFKRDEVCNELEVAKAVQLNPNCMEFVFEISDTGKGIPKEERQSVFENYVQVKDTAPDHEGTGLGLGIVQSLVRLMGGDIDIVDKEVGEKGTCFRFTAYLTVCQTDHLIIGNVKEDEIESTSHGDGGGGGDGGASSDSEKGPPIVGKRSPKKEVSHVVLFIQSEERRNVSQNFLERLGIKVTVVKHWEQLSTGLKKIIPKQTPSPNSRTKSKEFPLSPMDGTDLVLPSDHQEKTRGGTLSFVLVIIDTNGGPFRELSRAVDEFRREFPCTCSRVVWLAKPSNYRSLQLQGLDENKLLPSDLIMTKPLHGSRLYGVVRLLPEFGNSIFPSIEPISNQVRAGKKEGGSSREKTPVRYSDSSENLPTSKRPEIEEETGPLVGKRILLAEDDLVQQKITKSVLLKLGALVETCKNGEEALQMVSQGLSDQNKHGVSHIPPYDYILMDCQMPTMDGGEATRHIRKEEAYYGVRIPIIALTAHAAGDQELSQMYNVGVDIHLQKPLNAVKLLKIVSHFCN